MVWASLPAYVLSTKPDRRKADSLGSVRTEIEIDAHQMLASNFSFENEGRDKRLINNVYRVWQMEQKIAA